MPQVFGESRVNVHALFEQLRKQGELTLIGAETGVAENRFKRCAASACTAVCVLLPSEHAGSCRM